ncbi:hypothetical protein GQ43DRAFT_464496 [Delitschia confertaspora ATCC 74209]|uniref:Uncharacterized protein n=1 Tax=Delitschia confertaspora ATCC 74209 TaxID=1513339 RepID=A0A9P4JI30_9PLEO|nr:hypothetical protein GQ43DRAFT_464496 [Delitschia confertaspora ATCC 74209]
MAENLSRWKTLLQSALDPSSSNNGSYLVDHEKREGTGNLHLILVYYQPVHGRAKVVMPIGLITRQQATVENSSTVVAQSIVSSYLPQAWMGRELHYAVCNPFQSKIFFYNIDEQGGAKLVEEFILGMEQPFFTWAVEQNRPMYLL